MNNNERRRRVRNILRNIGASNNRTLRLVRSNKQHITFEFYIYALIVKAIDEEKGAANISAIRLNHIQRGNVFRLRKAPGNLSSDNFSYVSFSKNGIDYELHTDIKYCGHSNQSHEFDISLISHNTPQIFIFLTVECKYYNFLDFKFAREYVGALSDFYATQNNRFNAHSSYSTFYRNDYLITSARTASAKILPFMQSKKRRGSTLVHSDFLYDLDNNVDIFKNWIKDYLRILP
ncbi:hypothetical protein [Macrococcus bovicus]|uniref:hypothetical protein n=1 Tax=Macrococcus bovicus TaxID=69968 RepID=UPI0025A63BB1|nr:hypothetical protein [Macrococcus bovicus]WJP97262.1 hypothetical protein QSV55_08215 [Macrococcus bovicus]